MQGAGLIADENFDPVPGYEGVPTPCPPLEVTERDVDFTVQVPEESPSEDANTGRP